MAQADSGRGKNPRIVPSGAHLPPSGSLCPPFCAAQPVAACLRQIARVAVEELDSSPLP